MPGAPPARPARPRSLAEEPQRGPPPLHAGRCLPALSRHPHPRARTCRPPAPRPAPPLGLPALLARAAAASLPGFPTPSPCLASFTSPSPPRPLPLPTRLISSARRTSGSQIPPLSQLSAGASLFVEVTWWLRNPKGTRSPPTEDAGAGGGQGLAAQPVGSGCSRGTQSEKYK